MPAGISALAPSTEAGSFEHEMKDPPAFTILQKDDLDSSLPLLHVNEYEEINPLRLAMKNMKNTMKNENFCNRRRISKSNEHLVLASLQSNQVNPLTVRKKHQSKSQDSLDVEERLPTAKSSIIMSTEDFNEVLNAKLRKIQEQAEQGRRSPKKSIPQKKPFITTVKTGEFLMPPPEVAALLGIALTRNDGNDEEAAAADGCPLKNKFKPLISLAKRPEVRHSSHNARCPAALKATVDFSLGMMNATTLASTSTLDERARRFRRCEPA